MCIDMKRIFLFLALLTTILFVGCMKSNTVSDVELYGNTFLHIDDEDFNAPDSWVTHNMFDSAFQIKLPSYMHKSMSYPMRNGYANTIFTYRDTTSTGKYHYGRIGLDYYSGDFNKAAEYITYSEQEKILAPIVERALSSRIKIPDYTVSAGKLLNGPFYDSHLLMGHPFFYVYDASYRRKGNTGEGPVSCHIFLMMNKTEAVLMTVSYHDKDSVLFKNLFNSVKTFEWTKINK